MAIYLGNRKVSVKSGYQTTGMKAYFNAGGKCSNSTFIDLTNILKYGDTSNVTNMSYMFYSCSNLTTIPSLDTSNVTDMNSMFSYCIKLTTIHMKNMKVNFNISASTLFTRETLLEILNNLATVTSTQTLTMGNTNLAKLTDEDKVIATNKGWTLK